MAHPIFLPRKRRHRATVLLIASTVASVGLWTDGASAAPLQREAVASDPFERVNRVMFYINGAFDFLLLRPASITYKRVMPRPIRTVLHNAISNIGEPVVAINDILQGHGKAARHTVTRFLTNSTIGLVGALDVATPAGMQHHNNDFGLTLAHYGVKSGPYLFLPILGPTTVRDGAGSIADIGLDPMTWTRYTGSTEIGITRTVANGLDQRAAADKQIKQLMATATDMYASIRSFYLQNRQSQITGGKIDLDTLPSFGDEPAPAAPDASGPPAAAVPAAPDAASPTSADQSAPAAPAPGASDPMAPAPPPAPQ
jgi:phospholipid-binding lipoprotein MlaA